MTLLLGFEGKHGIGTDTDAGGLVLMGARLYDPMTGRFLQVDPVFGGSCNAYDYTCQDPVDGRDLAGTSGGLPPNWKNGTCGKTGVCKAPRWLNEAVTRWLVYWLGLRARACLAVKSRFALQWREALQVWLYTPSLVGRMTPEVM